MQPHSYEEIRDAAIDILLGRERVEWKPEQYSSLVTGVAEVLERRSRPEGTRSPYGSAEQIPLAMQDQEFVRDVFWDLFRQGIITLGLNRHNDAWPWFRLSHFGQQALATQGPYRFHDTSSFIKLVKGEVPDISPEALGYLDEAVAAFYAGCLLACCVMLGVAAEIEFLRLAEVAARSARHGTSFGVVAKQQTIRQKILKFQDCLKPIAKSLPQQATEDLDTNFLAIQSILRIARNEAGHALAARPQREQVYIYMQLFVPFARQLMRLRTALT